MTTTVREIDATATVGWNDGMAESGDNEDVAGRWAFDAIMDWLIENNRDVSQADGLYRQWRANVGPDPADSRR